MTHETTINSNYFSINVEELANPQSFSLQQLFDALETNNTSGILGDSNDLYRRRKSFGSNNNFNSPSSSSSVTKKSFLKLTLEASKDTTFVLLLCCVVLSLVIGIKRNGLQEALFDFAIILLPIFFVLNFSVIFRFFKARWISKKRMSRKKKVIRVLRHQQLLQIPSSEVVVGDIVFLEFGDHVPADGVLIQGNSYKFDDGSTSHDLVLREQMHHVLFDHTKLLEGNCQLLVTAVGENKERIKLMKCVASFQNDGHECYSKLQKSIDEMRSFLDKLSLSLSLIILVVQVFRCFLWKKSWCCDKDRDPKGVKNTMEEIMNEATRYMRRKRGDHNYGTNKVNGFMAMVCILVFSLKDGLSLGMFILLLYASIDMRKNHQIIVHKLPSCANGALVTTLCLSKTSHFVMNHTTLADLWIGFKKINDLSLVSCGARGSDVEVLNLLREGLCMNITCGVDEDALLIWGEKVLGGNIEEFHGSCSILNHENCYPSKGLCGVLLKRNKEEVGGVLHVHWKGEPKIVLSMCSNYYDINNGTMQTLDEEKRELFNRKIASTIVSNGVHCFAFAYKQVVRSSSSLSSSSEEEEEKENGTSIAKDGLSFLGIVVLKNPCSTELRRTIEVCRKSEIEIKLMVDDDLNTSRLMAINSGILRVEEELEGSIIEAVEFRKSPKEAQINMCHKIKVMANCSPSDKLLLVNCLRKRGQHVAATGSSIRDLPCLKEADVGIFFGENCADLAKEDADISIIDSNFGKILAILILARDVCTNLDKFIQLQLILNISAFTSNFLLIIFNPTSDQDQELTPFQLLWVNLIMEILGALFLSIITSSIKPHESVDPITLNYYGTGAPIVTNNMLRNIVVHSMLQVTLLLMLAMKGKSFFRVDEGSLSTMMFNVYVLCQVFLLIISAIEMVIRKTRISKGKSMRKWLLFMVCGVIIGIIVVLQVILFQIMSKIDHWKILGIKQWSMCIGIAALSLPIHYAAKMISSLCK